VRAASSTALAPQRSSAAWRANGSDVCAFTMSSDFAEGEIVEKSRSRALMRFGVLQASSGSVHAGEHSRLVVSQAATRAPRFGCKVSHLACRNGFGKSYTPVAVDNSRNDGFARGALLFDSGAFFEAHEAWETGWLVETDPTQRRFLQGLIQVAAGFHKLLAMGSVDSASRLLAKGIAKLDACPPRVGCADVATFRDGVRASAHDLAAGRFDRATIPKVGARTP